jgi:hypothetical protein
MNKYRRSETYSLLRPGAKLLKQQGVHFAGLLDVQIMLSADTHISRQTEGHSFGDHLISE